MLGKPLSIFNKYFAMGFYIPVAPVGLVYH